MNENPKETIDSYLEKKGWTRVGGTDDVGVYENENKYEERLFLYPHDNRIIIHDGKNKRHLYYQYNDGKIEFTGGKNGK